MPETMKLLESRNINDNNGENMCHLEITEIILVRQHFYN